MRINRRNFLSALAASVAAMPSAALTHGRLEQFLGETGQPPGARIRAILDALTSILSTDRAFIYMRDPVLRRVGYTHLVTHIAGWDQLPVGRWSPEPDPARITEPLLASAYRSDKVHFIEDIETAPPTVLNRAIERGYFGHRSLIHAPLYHGQEFYGILETALKDRPRVWSQDAQDLIHWLQPRLAELCRAYLADTQS